MKFLLEDKVGQAMRILVLLGGGAVFGYGMWVAFNLKTLSPTPIWIANILVVIIVTACIIATE